MQRASLPDLWRRIRRPLIGGLVALHFVVGFFCFASGPSALLEIPGLRQLIDFYNRLGYAQTWRMFAPPARATYRTGYALQFDAGWSELLMLDDITGDRARGRFFLPRGQIRLGNQLRHPNLRKDNLDDEPYFRHFFQQLAAFYCFGDGAVPGLRSIRFYSVVTPIKPFFPDDPTAPTSLEPRIEALYERDCSDR